MTMAKSLTTIKCPLSASCFDGHGGLSVQYELHLPIEHIQGYTGSHWAPPLGNYLLCIPPAAARATANKTTTKTCTHFSGHVDGLGGAPLQYRVHRPTEEVQGFTRSHWTLPSGEYCSQY
jgi:hypothetical protein